MIGVYLPLYNVALLNIVLAQMRLYRFLQWVIAINPSSGAIDRFEARFANAITEIHNLGGTAIGYIYTKYGARPIGEVLAQIDLYLKHYPNIDGIMLDELGANVLMFNYYSTIVNYARARGMIFVRGNPGGLAPTSFYSIFDNLAIEEDAGYQATYPTAPDKSKSSITIHSAAYNETEIRKMYTFADLCYVTSDSGGNPYDQIDATLFAQFCALVASLVVEPPPPPPPPDCEPGYHKDAAGNCVPDDPPPPPPPPPPPTEIVLPFEWIVKGLVAAVTFAVMTSVCVQPARKKEKLVA